MTIYSHPDDLGLAGTWYSLNWGSMGKPIACCNIRRYKWPFAVAKDEAVAELKEDGHVTVLKEKESEDGKGRGLDDDEANEYYNIDYDRDGEIDFFTMEQYKEFFADDIAYWNQEDP